MPTLMPIFCSDFNFISNFIFRYFISTSIFLSNEFILYYFCCCVDDCNVNTHANICSDFDFIFIFIFRYFISTSIFLSNEFILYYFILDRWQKFGTDTGRRTPSGGGLTNVCHHTHAHTTS